MDESEKPFDIVSIIILMMIAVANDAAEIFFDLLAATGVGIAGEAIMEPIDFIVDCIVTPWFFIKCGFGGPALAQILDDVLSFIGVPGRTICVGFGIYVANHPNSFIGKIGQTAATLETGGEAGLISEGEGAALKAEEEEAERAKQSMKGVSRVSDNASEETENLPKENSEAPKETTKGKEMEEVMEPESEQEPASVVQKELFEQTPDDKQQNNDEEENNADSEIPIPQKSNVVSMDDIRKNPRIEETRKNLNHPNMPRDITTNNSAEEAQSEEESSSEEAA